MTPRALAPCVRALLGPAPAPVLVAGARARAWERALAAVGLAVTATGAAGGSAVVSFLGMRADGAARGALLGALRAALPVGGALVVIDHNQPRRWWARLPAAVGLWRRGLGVARGRYPVAREAARAGFRVLALRLPPGERVQLVLARRAR